jgi:hypothetical protein
MKKILSLCAIGLCLGNVVNAQVQRTILYEEFTGENCAPCASTNPGLTTFIHQAGYFPTKVLMIRFQSPIPSAPGAGSLYQDNVPEVTSRLSYYSVPFAPYARFNGIELAEPVSQGTGSDGHAYWIEDAADYPNIVVDSSAANSPFSLSVSHALTASFDSVIITAVVTAAQNYNAITSGSLKLQIALEEAAIHFATAPGSNGEKDFYDVMRKMIPSVSGTALNNSWTTSATQTVTLKAKIPTYLHDKGQMAFVAFIQDNGSKRVHQAAYSQAQSLIVDAGIPTATLTPVSHACNDTLSLGMTLVNHGMHTVTTCTAGYKLDNNPVQIQTWTGSLATGQTSVLSFPTFTASPGSHNLLCYSSNPNDSLDMQSTNDTFRIRFYVAISASLPVMEGFETSVSLPNAVWNTSHSGSGGKDFSITNTAAASGSSSCMLDNMTNVNGNNSFLQTALAYDVTTLPVPALSFKAAYQQKVTTNADKLQIFTSTDCGATWVSRRIILATALASLSGGVSTSPYVPSPSQFTTYTVNINGVSGSHAVMFRWEFLADVNGPGNNLYIDDINIIDNSTGITNLEDVVNFNVYPNPAAGKFNLAFNLNESRNIAVNVTDMLGRVIEKLETKEYKTGELILPVGNYKALDAGMYLVNIQIDGQLLSRKVIVE